MIPDGHVWLYSGIQDVPHIVKLQFLFLEFSSFLYLNNLVYFFAIAETHGKLHSAVIEVFLLSFD